MNIYLDVDGVLIDKQGNPAKYLFEFLQHVMAHHSVFWLTTHCKGDIEPVVRLLERRVPSEIMPLIKQIQATNWRTLKTEAIDFTKDFRWFDDYPMEAEKMVLIKKGCLSKLCLVDLKTDSDVLSRLTF